MTAATSTDLLVPLALLQPSTTNPRRRIEPEALRNLAAAKPTVTVVEGVMASAMYWVGSGSNAVVPVVPSEATTAAGRRPAASSSAPPSSQQRHPHWQRSWLPEAVGLSSVPAKRLRLHPFLSLAPALLRYL